MFALPAGVVADRFDRKRVMIGCDTVRMLGAASIALVLLIGRPAYIQVVAVAFLDGGLFITSYICERGALRQVVQVAQLPDAVARNEARSQLAGIAGPSMGGALFAAARVLPFAADAASFVCSMAAIAATRSGFQTDSIPSSRSWRALPDQLTAGFAWLRGQPFFLVTAILFALGNPVYTSLELLAILIAHHEHTSAAIIGVMLTIGAVGGLLGAVLAGRIRRAIGARGLLVGETWLILAVVLLMLVAHNPLLIGGLLAAAAFVAPPVNAEVGGARVAAAPDHLQGRVQAVSSMLSMSLAWLGPLAVGGLFQHSGAAATTLVVAAWTLGLALFATLAPPIRRHRPGSI